MLFLLLESTFQLLNTLVCPMASTAQPLSTAHQASPAWAGGMAAWGHEDALPCHRPNAGYLIGKETTA